jgi:uncharacterized protein (TIGR00661 family)
MKIMFMIQGEGKGHLTQAIAVDRMLRKAGHKTVCAIIGRPDNRTLPEYVVPQLPSETHILSAPGFVSLKNGKGISFTKSILQNLRNFPKYRNVLHVIQDLVERHEPDLILNFYDPLCALWQTFYNRGRIPIVCIGHQYMMLHPEYNAHKGFGIASSFLELYTDFTSAHADLTLALSFKPYPDSKHIKVIPPLLRNWVAGVPETHNNEVLAYMVYPGFQEQVLEWSKKNPEFLVNVFTDRPLKSTDRVRFFAPDHTTFMQAMRRCSYYITTAGFESVCEAHYLGKCIFMVPLKGQYEQAANAREAVALGIAKKGDSFDAFVPGPFPKPSDVLAFRNWVDSAESTFLSTLYSLDISKGNASDEILNHVPIHLTV